MEYQIIFLTNLPAFYKIKLFNAIAERRKVLVVYTGEAKDNRNADFYKGQMHFEVKWLTGGTIAQCCQLVKLLRDIKYERLIFSGWDRPQMIVSSLLSPTYKNGCIVESSIYESRTTGIRAWIKRIVLRNVSVAYPSGILQEKLVRALGYEGRSVQYGGCGLLNYQPQPSYEPRERVTMFLYVGRLSPEKNLHLLLKAFEELPGLKLDIIGFGPQEAELRAMAPANVSFLGAIDNAKLPAYYKNHDAFILPSKSEPWGLVVEEALNNGSPVIVSNRVGCQADLVTPDTGLVFNYDSVKALREAVLKMTDLNLYNRLRLGVSKLDFAERAKKQIEAFIER